MTSKSENFDRQLQLESALRIGQVVEVNGNRVTVQVDKSRNSPHTTFLGETIKGVSVGAYVRIARGYLQLIGRVDGERISDNRDPDQQFGNRSDRLRRLLDLSLIGYITVDDRFEGGLPSMPLIANPCFLLTQPELERVIDIVPLGDEPFPLGTLLEDETEILNVGENSLVASHIGVFGNTGSGKSNTLAFVLESIFKRHGHSIQFRSKARFVVLDFNGEYLGRRDTVSTRKIITKVKQLKDEYDLGAPDASNSRLKLPIASAFDLEFWNVVLDATTKTQAPLIRRAVNNAGWQDALASSADFADAIKSILNEMTKDYNDSVERNSPASLVESLMELFSDVADPALFDDLLSFLREQVALNRSTGAFYFDYSGGSQGSARRIYSDNPSFRAVVDEFVDGIEFPVSELSEVRRFQARVILQYLSLIHI